MVLQKTPKDLDCPDGMHRAAATMELVATKLELMVKQREGRDTDIPKNMGAVYATWLLPTIPIPERVRLGASANVDAGQVHDQSFMDWICTFEQLVVALQKENPGSRISNSMIASRLGLSCGSIQKFYTPFTHMKPEVRAYVVTWDNTDWDAIAAPLGIRLTAAERAELDDREVVNRSAFYPSVLDPKDTLEEQMALSQRILQNFVRTKV